MSYKLKNQVYYTQGDDDIERGYNNSSEDKYSFDNKIIPDIQQMPDIQKIPDSDQKRPPLYVNDTKMPYDEYIPVKKQKRGKCTY